MDAAPTLVFPPFRCDLVNERLWRATQEIALRPKTFAVLRYLVERPGRLVTHTELLQAIWPDVYVSEALPRMCIRELRQALGDDAKHPQFIATVLRRGYRFIASVTTAPPVVHSLPPVRTQPSPPPRDPPLSPPLFVGRQAELTQLHTWVHRAAGGERQMVFVTGEAGIGKTTLIETLLTQISSQSDLEVAQGQCIEQHGPGEAYLPVLDALERLGHTMGRARLSDVLHDHAPLWLLHLPSLTPPAEREQLQYRLAGATRQRMLRELAQALEHVAADRRLILWLEDLQWSDGATLDFLAYLARRHEDARLMVIGTYRPMDVLARDHPLRTVQHELQHHGFCQELTLQALTEAEVAVYLTARCDGNGPGDLPALARWVHQRTEGHPLFMVTVISDLLDQGVTPASARPWDLLSVPTGMQGRVPHTLRDMIEQQVDRLSPGEQRLLGVGSVAGMEFSAAAIAAGLEVEAEVIEEQCVRLVRRRQFLQERGTAEWPDGTVAARYRFLHALYQEVLYERVPAGQRLQLHRRIGRRLEAAYSTQARDIAAELAMHFTRGRDGYKAVHYHEHAGANVMGRSAHTEAIMHFTNALQLLTSWPDTPERTQCELTLQLRLGRG